MTDEPIGTPDPRPMAVVAIQGGPNWTVMETYEQISAMISGAEGEHPRLELHAFQEELAPNRIQIAADLIVSVFEVTDERFASDMKEKEEMEAVRKQQEADMRRQLAAAGGPPGRLPTV